MIKQIVSSTFVLAIAVTFLNSTYKTAGGHPSSTGAPGEMTCARTDCHADASLTYDSPLQKLSFSNPANTYQTGKTYSIALELSKDNIEKFGFQIVAIDSVTQKNAGTWVLTEPSKMHIINGEAPTTDRKYITQSTAGATPAVKGKALWNFNWTAPAQNKGTIIFYFVTNATNNDDQYTGDQLFLSNYKVRFAQTGAVKPMEIPKPSVSISNSHLLISQLSEPILSVEIYDIFGKKHYQTSQKEALTSINLEDLKKSNSSFFVYRIRTEKQIISGKFWL